MDTRNLDSASASADFQHAGRGQLWIDFTRFLWGQHFLAASMVVLPATLPATFLGTISPVPSSRARGILLLCAHQRSALVDGWLRWLPEWFAHLKWMVRATRAFRHALARLSHLVRTAESYFEARQ